MYNNEQLNAIHFSNLSIEFDFYSKYSIERIKESLSSLLSKKIKVKEKLNTDFNLSYDYWALEYNVVGGSDMIKFSTFHIPYAEAKIVIAKTLKWIKENAETDDKCSMYVNVSFDENKLGRDINILKLDIGKFILNFDEDFIYEKFKNRENSIYCKSIKFMIPLSGMSQPSPSSTIWKNYIFAKDKYYGVNLSVIKNKSIGFNYIGGKDYQNKFDNIMKVINYYIISIYDVLINPKYTKEDKDKLNKIVKKHETVIKSYKSYKDLNKNFPDIKILIDLRTAEQTVELFYPRLRDKIFDLLIKCGMKEGLINYDSDIGKIQIKDTELLRCFELEGVDIFDSKLSGNISDCDIFNCEIEDSYIEKCNLFGSSTVKNSKLKNCYVNKNVVCSDSYVFGKMSVFSGEMENGVFKEGRITKFARFDDNTDVNNVEKI